MASKKFSTRVVQDDGSTACGIELPFNPKDVFGRVRAPVQVTINKHTFRTTTCSMGGVYFISLNKANRESAGVEANARVTVTLRPDDAPRTVTVPGDLEKALAKNAAARKAWDALSFTHQKEHAQALVEAKRPETRQRRLARTLEMLRGAKSAGTKPKPRSSRSTAQKK